MTAQPPAPGWPTAWPALAMGVAVGALLSACASPAAPQLTTLPLTEAQCVTVNLGDGGDCMSLKKWHAQAQWTCDDAALSVTALEGGDACATNRYVSAAATCCVDAPALCESHHAGSKGTCRTEAQWTNYASQRCALEGRSLAGTDPVWSCDGGFRYIRFTCCADAPPPGPCDDDEPLVCAALAPACDDDTILSAKSGCHACVDPWTCALPCEEGASWDESLGSCCPTAPPVAQCDCEAYHASVSVEVLDEAGCLVEEGCDCVPCGEGESCFDGCAASPCLNGGACTNLEGVASCACPEGFDGDLCEGCAPGFAPEGGGCSPCPTCVASPWPAWELEDIEPSSPGYQDTYGLAALPSSVTVLTLLVGW